MGATAPTQHDPPPAPDFPKGPKLAKAGICTQTGLLPNESCKAMVASFLPDTALRGACATEQRVEERAGPNLVHESLWKRLAQQ